MKSVRIKEAGESVVIDSTKVREWEVVVESKGTAVLIPLWDFAGELNVKIRLARAGAEVKIVGVVIGRGENEVGVNTLQLHEVPETQSELLIKSVLYERAKFGYSGKIIVARGAQKTDAYQRNENLLLSYQAKAMSKPGLEILADDVRCTHGATVGMVDKEQVWYLKSRGLNHKQAEKLIVRGFLSNAWDKIRDERIKLKLDESLRRYIW